MRLLIAAQLPPQLARHLAAAGHDAFHVQDLLEGVIAPDVHIAAAADAELRLVVTKDADFRHSHLVTGTPARLLLISTGNIRNEDLLALIDRRMADIETAFTGASFVERHRDVLIVHGSD